MANSVPVVDLGNKRKHEESSKDAVSKHSDCESDSDSDFACEALERANSCSTQSGKKLNSGIQPFTYLKGSSGVSTKEASSDLAEKISLPTNHASSSSNCVPEASANESESDSDGEEAAQVPEPAHVPEPAQVAEVKPAISSASVTLSSDINRSITKPAPSSGLTSSLKTDVSAAQVSYPTYTSRLVNTNSELARIRNLGNDSNIQSNSTSKYAPFHPLYSFPSQLSHQFNTTLPPPAFTKPALPPPPPPLPPSVRTQPPPPFNFFFPSPSPFPPFRPFFPPFLNLPPPLPHPPFPPPPSFNSMPYTSPPPR